MSARRCHVLCLSEVLVPGTVPTVLCPSSVERDAAGRSQSSCYLFSVTHRSTSHTASCPGDKMWPKIENGVLSPQVHNTGWPGSGRWGRNVAPVSCSPGSNSRQTFGRFPTAAGQIPKRIWGQRTSQGLEPKNMSKTPETQRNNCVRGCILGEGHRPVKFEFCQGIWPHLYHRLGRRGNIHVTNGHTPTLITLHNNPQFTYSLHNYLLHCSMSFSHLRSLSLIVMYSL